VDNVEIVGDYTRDKERIQAERKAEQVGRKRGTARCVPSCRMHTCMHARGSVGMRAC